MNRPVEHNLCEDLICEHRCICLRWRSPVDPNHPITKFPLGQDVGYDCPYLLDRRDLGR